MSIFSDFFNSNVRKIDPSPSSYRNIVQFYKILFNPLTISQNFLSISFFVKKVLQKPLGVFTQPPVGWARVKMHFLKCRIPLYSSNHNRFIVLPGNVIIVVILGCFYGATGPNCSCHSRHG